MHGLAVIQTISNSTTIKKINKMYSFSILNPIFYRFESPTLQSFMALHHFHCYHNFRMNLLQQIYTANLDKTLTAERIFCSCLWSGFLCWFCSVTFHISKLNFNNKEIPTELLLFFQINYVELEIKTLDFSAVVALQDESYVELKCQSVSSLYQGFWPITASTTSEVKTTRNLNKVIEIKIDKISKHLFNTS